MSDEIDYDDFDLSGSDFDDDADNPDDVVNTCENGPYYIMLDEASLAISKKGAPMVSARWHTHDHENPGDGGLSVFSNHMMGHKNPFVRAGTKSFLLALGLPTNLSGLKPEEFDGMLAQKCGAVVEVILEAEEYDGKSRMVIESFSAPAEAAIAVPEDTAKAKSRRSKKD